MTLVQARSFCFLACLAAAACSSSALIPCHTDAVCVPYGAVCLDGQCHRPPADLGASPDLSRPMVDADADAPATVDLDTPDLAPLCGPGSTCSADHPICGSEQVCRACELTDRAACADRDLHTPRCDVAQGRCTACRTAEEALDCPEPGLSVCGDDGSCRKACDRHEDCASGICDPLILTPHRRSCARPDEVVYVRADPACAGSHAGTEADPMCTLDAAFAARPAGGFVRVLDSGTRLGRAAGALSHPYVVVGAGTIEAPPEVVSGQTVAYTAIAVEGGGRLYLEGVHLTNAGTGIACDGNAGTGGGAAVVLERVIVDKTTVAAVRTASCDLGLDRVRMASGKRGLLVSGGRLLQLTNAFVVDNSNVGVEVSAGTIVDPEHVAFLTVIKNAGLGFVCGAAMNIRSSIAWFNGQSLGASYSGACAFSSSDVDPAVAGNANLVPSFPTIGGKIVDWHLNGHAGNNDACCVDHGVAVPGLAADYDGQPRQNGGAPDVGADEI